MKKRQIKIKKEPPPDSPIARAKVLNQLARERSPAWETLPAKERQYVECLHKCLVQYWHRQISQEALQGHQKLLAAHLLCESQKSYYTRLWFGEDKGGMESGHAGKRRKN